MSKKKTAIVAAAALVVGAVLGAGVTAGINSRNNGTMVSSTDVVKTGSCGESAAFDVSTFNWEDTDWGISGGETGILSVLGTGAIDDNVIDEDAEAADEVLYEDDAEDPEYESYWGTDITTALIQEGITGIGSHNFAKCGVLSSVSMMGDTVTEIGDHAFAGCSELSCIELSSNIETIGAHAFDSCSSLSWIDLPSALSEIGDYAFGGCVSLDTLVIPSSVTTIGEKAFYNCSNVTTLVLPASVASVGDDAFAEMSMLQTVVYCGTEEDFEALGLDFGSDVTVQYHSYGEGEVTEATCTESGFTTYTCEYCDDTYSDDFTEPLGHDYMNGVCRRCGEEHEHDYKEVIVSANCKNPEMTIYICRGCYNSYSESIGTELGDHQYVNGVCIVCGAEEPADAAESESAAE